jgi:peptidoglycan/xylan/chitin deacetylase (PgdA/CDA1 family)
MKYSIIIKKILSYIFYSLGIPLRKIDNRSKVFFLILMYHRIVPGKIAERDGLQAGMFVMPETFEMHIGLLKKHFNVVPLSEALMTGNREECGSDNKPLCAITFDDGWFDFYKYAYPVLKKENVFATVFLATDYVGTMNRFWTDRLSSLLVRYKDHVDKNPLSSNTLINLIEGYRGDFESHLEFAIGLMKDHRIEVIEDILAELSERWKIRAGLNERAFLSWDEIMEMKETGLIAFGSHTSSHPILTTLESAEVRKELLVSRRGLIERGVVDPSSIPFCYPNGNHNKEIVDMVKESGYSLAVTTTNDWNAFGCDPFTLRRIGVHQDMTSTRAMFACKIAQLF